MYEFWGRSVSGPVKIGGVPYLLTGNWICFKILESRWVADAVLFGVNGQVCRPRYRGKINQLVHCFICGSVLEHPEQLGLLPQTFNLSDWICVPDDQQKFDALWASAMEWPTNIPFESLTRTSRLPLFL